jgi:hypothetical protein
MLLGSGTVVVVLVVVLQPQVVREVPRSVNASEGIVPTEFCEAMDGPEFSSQYIGSPVFTTAFCKFSQ